MYRICIVREDLFLSFSNLYICYVTTFPRIAVVRIRLIDRQDGVSTVDYRRVHTWCVTADGQ